MNLYPLQFYNITSAFGCYKPDPVTLKAFGDDPNVHYVDDPTLGPYGCSGQWQSTGSTFGIIKTIKEKRKTVEVEEFVTVYYEAPVTVWLLENAMKLKVTYVTSLLAFAISAFTLS